MKAYLPLVFVVSMAAASALIAAVATNAGPSQAAAFTVTKTADTADGTCDGDCSLREAINAPNAAAGADTITLPAAPVRSRLHHVGGSRLVDASSLRL